LASKRQLRQHPGDFGRSCRRSARRLAELRSADEGVRPTQA
jgi:hypothetical protein